MIRKSVEFFKRENRGNAALLGAYDRAVLNGITEATSFCLWNFFWVRDAAGKTMADRWADKRYDGLTNDERAIFSAQRGARPAVFEVRKIVNETTIEIVDLLSGARQTLVDASFASRAVRFTTLFTWLVPSPHFTRLLGSAILFPDAGSLTALEIFRAIEMQLGVPSGAEEEQRWLGENWMKFVRAIQESSKAIHITTMASVDANKHAVEYAICGAASTLRAKLEQHPAVEPCELSTAEENEGFTHSYVQLQASDSSPAGVRNEVVGSIFLSETAVRIEAIGAEKSAELRSTFEELAGGAARFCSESKTDTAPGRASGTFDAALVPQLLLDNAPKIKFSTTRLDPSETGATESAAEVLRKHHEEWPDSPIPTLGGKTPREAAADPELRGAVIHIVKNMARMGDGKSYRESVQATETIELLGLHEIAEPTPPKRPALYSESEPAETFPGPPVNALTHEEVFMRLSAMHDSSVSGKDGELSAHFVKSAADLLDCLDDMLAYELNELELVCLTPALAIVYHILAPKGTRRDNVNPDRLYDLMEYWEPQFEDAFEAGFTKEALTRLIAASRQPLVTTQAFAALYAAEEANLKQSFRRESLPAMLAFILAAVDELDITLST